MIQWVQVIYLQDVKKYINLTWYCRISRKHVKVLLTNSRVLSYSVLTSWHKHSQIKNRRWYTVYGIQYIERAMDGSILLYKLTYWTKFEIFNGWGRKQMLSQKLKYNIKSFNLSTFIHVGHLAAIACTFVPCGMVLFNSKTQYSYKPTLCWDTL